jgi:protein CLEC16A
MASTVAAALFHQPDGLYDKEQGTPNGFTSEHDNCKFENYCTTSSAVEQSNEDEPNSLSSVSWKRLPNNSPPSDCCQGNTPRYVTVAGRCFHYASLTYSYFICSMMEDKCHM